jgi:hypothetical protein
MSNTHVPRTCAVCGRSFPVHEVVPGTAVREGVASEILQGTPDLVTRQRHLPGGTWPGFARSTCTPSSSPERGELSSLEREVVESPQHHDLVSSLSACIIKGIERVAPMLKFSLRSISVRIHGVRQDAPPHMERIDYESW